MHILPFYAALLAIVFVALGIRALRLRRKLGIAVGDGSDERMLRAMRVHANFAEYIPLALLLVFFVEARGASPWLVHGLALALLLGRLSHAWGVSQVGEDYRFRVFGMAMTFTPLIVASAYLLLSPLMR